MDERKQIDRDCPEGEKLYGRMLNDSDNAVFVHELTKEGVPGKFIEVNDVACQLLGYTRKELYTLTPLDIISVERSHFTSRAMEKLLAERQILFETWFISKTGKKIPVAMNSQLLHLKGEMAVLSIAHDMLESMETYGRERGKLPEWEKEDLSLFYMAGHLFCSTLEQERVFQEVTRRCVDALHVDFCLLRLVEDGRLVLRNSFFRNPNEKGYVEKLLAENPIHVGEGIAGRVAQTGEPVTSDSLPVEELTLPGYVDFLHPRSWLLVPMKLKEKVIGVLTFITAEGKRVFSHRDFTLAQGIANQAAVAIDNARLFGKLERSERLYRTILESSADAIVSLGPDLTIIAWSEGAEQIFGYTREEIIGRPLDILVPEHELPTLPQKREEAVRTGFIRGWETQRRAKDGRLVDVEITLNYMGTEFGFTAILRDVTQRKKAEELLRQSEERYRILSENAMDGIYILSLERFEYVNPAFEKIFGYTAEQVCDKSFNFYDLIYPADRKLVEERRETRIQGKIPPSAYSFRILTKDGEMRYVEVNTVPFPGEGTKVMGILRDVTERKQAETEKARLQQHFLQLQKTEAVGRLAGGIAHDFNNFLTAINGYSELVLMKIDDHNPLKREIEQIKKAGERAASLTRHLLAFSRSQPLQPQALDLNFVVRDMEKMLSRLIAEDIVLRTVLEPGLQRIKADPGQIEQVVMNMVINARDAMHKGGEITVTTENVTLDKDRSALMPESRLGEFVCLSFADTGVGMSTAIVQHIFEPFFTTKEDEMGTGLGLSVVYGIVKQHQGWITVSSEPGRGSTFKVYLPAYFMEPTATTEMKVSLHEIQGDGERILLVEDEPVVCEFAVRALSENGYIVFSASNGEEAADIFEKEQGDFDLVFSDVVLPDRDGLKLIDEFISRKPEVSVLLSSGYTDKKSQWDRIKAKSFPFLQKPYALVDLLIIVKKVIEKRV